MSKTITLATWNRTSLKQEVIKDGDYADEGLRAEVYWEAHGASEADESNPADYQIGQSLWYDAARTRWRADIRRQIIYWNTDNLRATAVIHEVKWRGYITRYVYVSTGWYLQLKLGHDVNDIPRGELTSYPLLLSSGVVYHSILADDIPVNDLTAFEFTFPPEAHEFISKGGALPESLTGIIFITSGDQSGELPEQYTLQAQIRHGIPSQLIIIYSDIPTVTTNPATDITSNSAILNGTLDNDGGEACVCGFEWGETEAYGNTTPTQSKAEGESFAQQITGLTPDTTYHFRAFATNIIGTGYGADRTFTTPSYSQCSELEDGSIDASAPVEVEPLFEGVTTADGAPDGSTLVCSDLTAEPDYDGDEVGIFDGPYAGETRVIHGTTLGGTVTLASPFSGQITAGTPFGIFAIVSGSWADVHDASVPPICDVHDSEYELVAAVGFISGSPSYYYIDRAFLYFDTSEIEVGATIDEAILALFLNGKVEDNAGYATLHVVEGVQASPLECADWGKHLDKVVSAGSVAFADWVSGGYTPIVLNAIGRSWINKGGITKFCLRLVSDIDDTPPPGILYAAENGIAIYSAEKGVLYCPRLSLTYTVGRIWKGNIIIDQLIYQHAERMAR